MSAHQFQIAREVSPSFPRLSIGRPACSSLTGRSPAIIHDQIETHGSGGAALRRNGACCARVPVPAREQGSRLVAAAGDPRTLLRDCLLTDDLPDLSRGEVLGSLFPNLRTQPRRQAVRYVHKSHFRNSSSDASTTSWKRFADEQKPCVAGAKID